MTVKIIEKNWKGDKLSFLEYSLSNGSYLRFNLKKKAANVLLINILRSMKMKLLILNIRSIFNHYKISTGSSLLLLLLFI